MLATQTLIQKKAKNMRVTVDGKLPAGVTAKDIILAIIGEIGTAGGTGHVIEYAGEAIRALSMEGRMTVCNMSIEGGARAGLIAPDETTFAYIKGRPRAPKGGRLGSWRCATGRRSIPTTARIFDREVKLDAAKLPPIVTWGTSPEDVVAVTGARARPDEIADETKRAAEPRARLYGPRSRQEDHRHHARPRLHRLVHQRPHRGSARRRQGRRRAARCNANVSAMVVPGSGLVKEQAEAEGLDKIFKAAGFEWREPGCSMCLAMNADQLAPAERCASTSNRNFEGRQGRLGRTHLVSPAMAAAAAIAGHFVDIRDFR